MNVIYLVLVGLVAGSASGAAIATEFDSAPTQDKLDLDGIEVVLPASPSDGCGDCPPEDAEPEEPSDEQPSDAPPTDVAPTDVAPEEEAPEECDAAYSHYETGRFERSAFFVYDEAPSSWQFPVACEGALVSVELVLSGNVSIDFDNRMLLADGEGQEIASEHTALNYGLDSEVVMFQVVDAEGEVGDWVFDLAECGLIGDYELTITVS